MTEVKRKKGESFESLLRRFGRRVQSSGRLIQAKKVRFHEAPKSKTKKKRSALHKIAVQEKRTYLEKIGKLPDEPKRRGFRR